MNSLRKLIKEQLENLFEEKITNFILEEYGDKLESLLWSFGKVERVGEFQDFGVPTTQNLGAGFEFYVDGAYFFFSVDLQGNIFREDFGIKQNLGNLNNIEEVKKNFEEASKIPSKSIKFNDCGEDGCQT